jgi:hypothetical protein
MRKTWLLLVLLIPLAILGLLIHSEAQTPTTGQPTPAAKPKPAAGAPSAKPRDGSKMPETAQAIFFSAHPAMEWFKRTIMADGRFVYGFQPALRVKLEGDNFTSQAGSAFALARAARYFRDQRGTAFASQACLSLLLETMVDPEDRALRFTAAPPAAVDRLASHGLLISAIHELDSAEEFKDLLLQADQLCNYLWQQQRPDGSLRVSVGTEVIKSGNEEFDAEGAGWALQGIIRSHKHRPAAWKLEVVRKARAHYLPYWQQNKNIAAVCSHTPAYAEAYLQTKDQAFAEAVFQMNDWLVGLQYPEDFDSARKHWVGGFQRHSGGKQEPVAPDIRSALPAESLAEACRVAKHAGDLTRLQRYERALINNLHFLMSLQYTRAKTEHFVDNFRPSILGAFHASHQDGNLRIDYTQHALCAMVQYLDAVID